jgi:carbohydrate-selective porin OprB
MDPGTVKPRTAQYEFTKNDSLPRFRRLLCDQVDQTMKKHLLAAAASAVFAVIALYAESPRVSYSHPPKYMSLRSADWWESGELTDDWGGPRNTLYDWGVSIFANYTNNIAGNPVGGKSAGFTYCDNFTFGLDLDLEKLISWKGGIITVSGLNRDGSNLSEKNIGNQFTVSRSLGDQR